VFDSVIAMSESATTDVGDHIAALVADLDWLDGRGLTERLQELERLQRRLEHAIVSVVGQADRRGVWAEDGHRSVRGWCMATAHWSHGDTTHRIRSVTMLDDLAAVDEALATGAVGVAQVRELARARANPRCGRELADCEEVLLADATSLPYDEFRRCVQRWEALADADGAHRDHEQTHAARAASFVEFGNGYHLAARSGVAQGAAMEEIFNQFIDAEFHADWDEARTRLGDDVTPADLARTAAQRRFDALHAIFLAAASTQPGARAPEPVVDIVVDQTTFEAAMTAMADGRPLDDVMPPVGDPTRRRCETIHGVPVDPLDAVVAALIGHVRRVVFDSESCTIDLGTTTRLFRGAARLAVWLQATRCLWPGCGRRHCQIDHSRSWNEHGTTSPRNGAPLCGHHNRWKTRGYRTWRDPNGHWHTYRPDGTEIAPA
jgi:hypothetical protein